MVTIPFSYMCMYIILIREAKKLYPTLRKLCEQKSMKLAQVVSLVRGEVLKVTRN